MRLSAGVDRKASKHADWCCFRQIQQDCEESLQTAIIDKCELLSPGADKGRPTRATSHEAMMAIELTEDLQTDSLVVSM